MEIKNYLKPAEIEFVEYEKFQWGSCIKRFDETGFPDLEGVKLAIFGVGESRNAPGNRGCSEAPDKVREYFYKLSTVTGITVADIGNLKLGETGNDTYHAVEYVCSELLENKILPVIIGGSQDLTFGNYLAFQKRKQTVNLVCIDRQVDLMERSEEKTGLTNNSYLSTIIGHPSALLFNLSLIGYQSYFTNNDEIEMLQKMYFDAYRLGLIQTKIEEAEPIVRNADILSFDISSIRQSDAPGCENTTPNGFYGEEACQIMRYAGMSDKLSSVGIYELNPACDNRGQTAHLAAQMLWYFVEGFANRKNDFPVISGKDYMKFRVTITNPAQVSPTATADGEHELVFFKSLKTERWWMEVPFTTQPELSKFERHHLVPCSYDDYLLACSGDMPDRWWQAYQKLN